MGHSATQKIFKEYCLKQPYKELWDVTVQLFNLKMQISTAPKYSDILIKQPKKSP